MVNNICPVNNVGCPCELYSKENLCDYPYMKGMNYEQCQQITNVMNVNDDTK